MRCPSCGWVAKPGDVFCASCGHELAPPTCPRCSTVIRSDARFCVSCGAALEDAAGVAGTPSAAPPPPTSPPSRPVGASDDDLVFEEDPGPPLWEARLAPAGGLAVRSELDAAAPAVTDVAAGTKLLVLEQRGQWARVSAGSGWSGWVDARRLVDPDLADVRVAQDDGSG